MLYVLFGEMGIGKNYVGERLASHLGCEFFDGDLVVPPSMVEKVVNFKPLSYEDIHQYVHKNLIPAIAEKVKPGESLVVAQALYMREHREAIQERLHDRNPQLVYLPVTSRLTHMKRLYSRDRGALWAAYGLWNSLFFQKPEDSCHVILNETGADLARQFDILLP